MRREDGAESEYYSTKRAVYMRSCCGRMVGGSGPVWEGRRLWCK